ncbi:MAG TPA: hypothetical protein VFF17_07880 [Thermoanaerobaculia bacterium]|nr:hypothetical protein [Thermoanaerobaculia bacterium]
MSPTRLAAILALGLFCGAAARAEKVRNHFDADAAMRPPGFFDAVVWGARGDAEWRVIGDTNPPSAPNRLIQTLDGRPSGSIAAALRRNYVFQDGRVSSGLRRGPGHGGVVIRAAGEKDFVVLLIDLTTGDARLSSHRDGKATELARGTGKMAHEWGILSVEAAGTSITARWNGEPLLKGSDPRPIPGRSGLATAGPGAVSFDEFILEPVGGTTPASSPKS